LIYEGYAFIEAVSWRGAAWLDGDLIRRWLPVALFSLIEERIDVTRRCYEIDPSATVEAAIKELDRDALREEASVAGRFPNELWTDSSLRRAVAERIERPSLVPKVRGALLRLLAKTAGTNTARTEVRDIAKRLVAGDDAHLGFVAIDVLLATATKGSERVEAATLAEGHVHTANDAAIAFHGTDAFGTLNYVPADWEDEDAIHALVRTLTKLALPWDEPPMGPRFVGPEDHLRELRDQLLAVLARRPTVELEELTALVPAEHRASMRQTFEAIRSRRATTDILATLVES
jgi:hypothetical protein